MLAWHGEADGWLAECVHMPDLDAQIDELKGRVLHLRDADVEHRVFGAYDYGAGHEYRLAPPLTEAQVAGFERRFGVRLPEDYRTFLLRVASGGAGPYYGLMPFDPDRPGEAGGEGLGVFPFTEETPASALPHQGMDLVIPGAIPLSHLGCAYYHHLVVAGPAHGTVWADYTAVASPMIPLRLTFLAWYRQWLDACFAGLEIDARIDQVKLGMTREQIAEVLGRPPTSEPGKELQRYGRDVPASFWMDSGGRLREIIRRGIGPDYGV